MERDPAREKVNINNRQTIVLLGPIQPQIDFPSSGSRNLKFQKSWFAREDLSQWLEYSQSKDAAFCFVCRCFGSLVGCSDKQFVEDGFRTWSKASGDTGAFSKHIRSRMHILSTERSLNLKTDVPVSEQLGDQLKAEKSRKEVERKENREVVTILMDCLLFLAKQGLAFRGHTESSESSNRGNFIELVYFMSCYNPQLKSWLEKHPGNVTYMSAEIQNEFINIAAERIRNQVSTDVRNAGYFSLICDEVSDVSNTEWITIVLRYVKDVEICESLIAIVPTVSLTAAVLCEKVLSILKEYNISTDMMVGQCYDGASNMSGQHGGLQAKINEITGHKAVYVHCYAHALNLVVSNAMQKNRFAENVFGNLQKLYAFIERTPKRHHIYMDALEKQSKASGTVIVGKKVLQTLSNTRWSARADNLEIACNCLPAIIIALQEFKSEPEAVGLLHIFTKFDFVFAIHVLCSLLNYCKHVSDYLQTEDLDLVAALHAIADLKTQVQDMRSDDSFERFWSQSSEFCLENQASGLMMEDDPSIQPRKRKVPNKLVGTVMNSFIGVSEYEGNSLKDDLRVSFYFAILDGILSNILKRFDGRSAVIMRGVASLHVGSESNSNQSLGHENEKSLKDFAQFYGINADECLSQYHLIKGNSLVIAAKPKQLKDVWRLLVKSKLRNVYPAFGRALQIAVTLPVTSASAERVHSKLKLIKTFSRSTSGDVRSADLIQIYFQQDIKINLSELVTAFATKPRKLAL